MIIKNESEDLINALKYLDKYCMSRKCEDCLINDIGDCFKRELLEAVKYNLKIKFVDKICHYDVEKYMDSIK